MSAFKNGMCIIGLLMFYTYITQHILPNIFVLSIKSNSLFSFNCDCLDWIIKEDWIACTELSLGTISFVLYLKLLTPLWSSLCICTFLLLSCDCGLEALLPYLVLQSEVVSEQQLSFCFRSSLPWSVGSSCCWRVFILLTVF